MRTTAQSLIEVTVGIVILIPVVLVLVDLGMISLAVQTNDTTCLNAVRSVASGNPIQAAAIAQSQVDADNKPNNGALISKVKLVQPVTVQVTSQPVEQVDVSTGKPHNPGGPVTGTATVVTEVRIRPFILHLFYGGKSPIDFRSRQTFPLSYIVPAS